MSYALVVAEVRRGIFEERNLDSIGLCALLGKDAILLIPEGDYGINEQLVNGLVRVKTEETLFLNPLNMMNILEKIMAARGKPDMIVFTNSASGIEIASYAAGHFNLPVITDVNGYDKERGIFFKSYYSDKIFGEFRPSGEGTFIITAGEHQFIRCPLTLVWASARQTSPIRMWDGRNRNSGTWALISDSYRTG